MKKIFFGLICLAFFIFAQYYGLFVAPPDRMMGEVYRILFVHVPTAWSAMLLLTLSFIGSLIYILTRRKAWDRLAFCAAEIGLMMIGLALVLGSIWGKPTWGVYWTWDPRLTTTAILFILYSGYLILRGLIEDPEKRAKISAVLGLLIYLNVPVVYMSVKWWRTLHQVQSNSQVLDEVMAHTLFANFIAFTLVTLFFLTLRMKIASQETLREERDSLVPPSGGYLE